MTALKNDTRTRYALHFRKLRTLLYEAKLRSWWVNFIESENQKISPTTYFRGRAVPGILDNKFGTK